MAGYSSFGSRASTTDSKTGQRSTSPRPGIQQQHAVQHGYTGIIRQAAVQGTSLPKTSLSSASGSLSILSSILRGPPPSQPGQTSTHQSQAVVHAPVTSYRVCSPIRVITSSMPASGPGDPPPNREVITQHGGGLSPSRMPITLPPKKSLSPSMVVYSDKLSQSQREGTVHIVTQRKPSQSPQRGQGESSSKGQPSSSELNLLSHLPFLQQTLQQQPPSQGSRTHEALFQQYKIKQERSSGSQKGSISEILARTRASEPTAQAVASHVIAQRDTSSPRPAHIQMVSPPPTHVPAIQRIPSPAHLQLRSEQMSSDQEKKDDTAMNLSKPVDKHTELWEKQIQTSKPQLEKKWSDEFRYGDLLQSIQRSQQTMQSQLLQQDLSPITPSEPGQAKSWAHSFVSQPQSVAGRRLDKIPSGIATTSFALLHRNVTSESIVHAKHSSVAPITMSASNPIPVTVSAGFVPVMLPSQRLPSPPRRSPSPKSRSTAGQIVSNVQPVVSLGRIPSPAGSEGVRVSQLQNVVKYTAPFTNVSVTQAGPPNVTITSHSNIMMDKPTHVQRNPFTFPATPPVSLTNENLPVGGGVVKTEQSKLTVDGLNQKQRHGSDEMPCLVPVSPFKSEKKPGLDDVKEEPQEFVKIPQPYNMRIQNLNNFPNNSTYRPTYRATSVAIHRAKAGCIISTAKSLDILRQNLQKAINKELQAVIQSYLNKYFSVGIENIKLNNGENSVSEDHIQAVCRQILEEAKKVYTSDTGRRSITPTRDLSDVSETGSNGRRSSQGRRRHPSDTDSEASHRVASKKKKSRHIITGRSTPSKLAKEQYKREGPKYDPERLTEETQFIMGSRANKAMGFGATRGRLYMKHPDLFKYNGDQDDKTWLYENHHMPATGGKSYLIVLGDLKELAQLEEYKNNTLYNIDELSGFTVPIWMIEKMRLQMMSMRTDLPKQAKNRSRSVTPNDMTTYIPQIDSSEAPHDLPFASFSSPKPENTQLEATEEGDDDMEFLSAAGNDDPNSGLSPFNMTGGFDDTASPSDLDTMEEETTIEPSFGLA